MENYNTGIYIIQNTVDSKVYVGSSKRLKRRKYEHWRDLRIGKHRNQHLQNAWNKYGEGSFCWEVVEYCEPVKGLLKEREDWWIGLVEGRNPHRGYNLRSANEKEVPEETRAKISASLKGKPWSEARRAAQQSVEFAKPRRIGTKMPATSRGEPMAEETKQAISATLKGKPKPEGFGQKISAALKGNQNSKGRPSNFKGKTQTLEARNKISVSQKGNSNWKGKSK